MNKNVLVINCGSSSVKFALVNAGSGEQPITGLAEKLGGKEGLISWRFNGGDKFSKVLEAPTHLCALKAVVRILEEESLLGSVIAVGHRLVHGGEHFSKSTLIDDNVLSAVEACSSLAPLHNPANITGVKTTMQLLPKLPQVGVFDTAFHQTLPERAFLYPLPYEYYEKYSVRKYGFHGTSHRYVSQKAAKMLNRPLESLALLSAHLGNGCSAASILNGKSLDTTMGLTPLEGLVMGTRSGDIDPGLHAYLAKTLDKGIDEVTDILNKKSGLLGLSGVSNDMRELLAAAKEGNSRANIAVEVFCYRLAKALAALAVPLGRIDALIFTGGIGENSVPVREKVLNNLGIFGFEVDSALNVKHGKETVGRITKETGTLAMVVPTDEEYMIAKDTLELID